ETWHLIQAIRKAIQSNDSTSRNKIQEILNKMDNLFPASKSFLSLTDDDHFLSKHNHEFNNYFPEDIARYIYKEMKAYYDDKENSSDKDNNK
ncbi:hypothetical protein AJ85_09765, partial [Alkalihalobacillus alcalophilus ATCC 27647 = CGMCC 1.3604]